jgi:Flp pilus assembly protein TadG
MPGWRRITSASFAVARGGNVAMMWALMAGALAGLAGLTVDFTRAQMIRAQMQNAVDGAALVAARATDMTDAERVAAARAFFDAEMGNLAGVATLTLTQLPDSVFSAAASMPMPMTLARIVSDENWRLHVEADAARSGVNLEVALVLDTTGSMAGQRIVDLRAAATDLVNTIVRDEQTPYYSKLALVTYSMGVNLGGYATQARGPITGPTNISAAAWHDGASKAITGATRANPVTITSANHGLTNGAVIYISGVSGMTQINNKVFTVAGATTNTFTLQGVNGSSYGSYSSGGVVRRCLAANCGAVITSSNHGLAAGEHVYITGVNGMTQLNGTLSQIAAVTANTFTLAPSAGGFSAYSSGGNAYCTRAGCEYFTFMNAASPSVRRVFPYSTCVSERIGAQAYTDAGPGAGYVGYNYTSTGNPCPSNTVVPLTTDRTLLNGRIAGLTASGSTAGQIGLAWGWHMLSPDWAHLWPAANRPASYTAPETMKIVVLMTDGAFNTTYCEGVIGRDSNSGAGGAGERNTCNATNGGGFAQAQQLCTAMKARGVIVYTVGFHLGGDAVAQDFLEDCATTPSHAHLTGSGAELVAAFQAIAASISQLRLTR